MFVAARHLWVCRICSVQLLICISISGCNVKYIHTLLKCQQTLLSSNNTNTYSVIVVCICLCLPLIHTFLTCTTHMMSQFTDLLNTYTLKPNFNVFVASTQRTSKTHKRFTFLAQIFVMKTAPQIHCAFCVQYSLGLLKIFTNSHLSSAFSSLSWS